MLFCIRVPNLVQIETPTAEIWRHIDFQDGNRQPCCICFWVMADHPRSAFRGLNPVLKSLVCRINSSGDIAMYRFWSFWLETAYSRPFLQGEFLGHIFPISCYPSSWPPNGPSLGGNTSFGPFSVRIGATVRSGRVTEEKIQDNKKITKELYFPYLGEAPTGSIRPKSCMVGDVRDVIMCVKFQIEIFMGYDFTGGLIFDFPIDFCMDLVTIVQR